MAARIGWVVAVLALAACTGTGAPAADQRCEDVFSAERCSIMTEQAAVDLGLQSDDIASIAIIPEPTPEVRDGVTILMTRSGGPPIDLRVTLADGSIHVVSMDCVGIASNPACVDDPHLTVASIIHGGYHDTPCTGEPPDGCATPVPTVEPKAAAAATALAIDRLDIPIDHVGDYEVKLGEAQLPNGLLSQADVALVDDWPPGVTILSGDIGVRIRSLEPDGLPFVNIFEHGWRPGTERVEAVLVFHVDRFEPGAVLSVKDVVVR